ncbi:MAG: TIGR02147 family protein, partial [Polyangiales bacterium]
AAAKMDVFRYLDYRKFLGEFYKKRKQESRAFSYRAFARRCGLRSPNHLKRVIERERNLSSEAALSYVDAIGLEGDAGQYFCELVRFDQAKTRKERDSSYRRLTQYRGYRKAHGLDASHHRYHSTWYIPAIREMLPIAGFKPEPKWIAGQLIPSISEKEAAEALDVLEELGMITRTNGVIERSDQVVSTGPETSGLHIVNYHAAMMDKAIQSIDIVAREERDISGVTLCLPSGAIPTLKERIREFRKEVLAMEASEGEGDAVVQLAVQLFPLTKSQDT